GLSDGEKAVINKERVKHPLSVYNCPSRRSGGPYPNAWGIYYKNAANPLTELARTDYACNAGDQSSNEFGPGPNTLTQGDTTYNWPDSYQYTGVIFVRSQVRFSDITNGSSNTFIFGEKYLNPVNYLTGNDPGDNESMYVGMDNDTNRVTYYP